MSGNHRHVPKRVKLTIDALEEALCLIDLIDERDRTPELDEGLREAADDIYGALEILKSIDLTQYKDIRDNGSVPLRTGKRPRINHVLKVEQK